ncbi:MAG: ABC-type antimicrobial peptide transport system, permease component [Ktedonobacterales bacterium]|jgi:putative ABC transport system permease protein|nr:MAG: ABC-type antimicrobial peptide transport system, permease component [Ktedonobacterales bacterium]
MSLDSRQSVEPAKRDTLPKRGGHGGMPTHHGRRNTLNANFASALEALWANRLRSLLTALGVIVGVAAVIGAVTLTQGTSALINSRITGLGTNTLTISPGATQSGGAFSAAGTRQSLKQSDADAMSGVAHVQNVSPVISVQAQIVYADQNTNTRVQGVYPNYQSIGTWTMSEGSWFSDADESSGNAVAVLGQTTVDNLFATSTADPVGQTILINSQAFQVVGVLKAKGTTGFQNQDDVIYVPFNAAQARLDNIQYVSQIAVQVDDANNVNSTQAAITTLLEQRHNLPTDGSADDFTVRSSNQLVQTAQTFTQTLTFLLVGVAAISLLVGGIGIMNIMLVSVTERTREIGIRMAIGARRRDIRNQFLIEALTLSTSGGAIGIIIGLALGLALTIGFSLPFAPSIVSIVLAFAVASGIGVAFGLYPAVRASRLDPIVALRTE